MTNKISKYYVIVALSAIFSAISYILGQPQITEGTLISGALVGLGLAIHDLESSAQESQPSPSQSAQGSDRGNPQVKQE
jgi:hypothetical protein